MGLRPLKTVGGLVGTVLVLAAPARGAGDSDVAALQVALKARGLYAGTIDGIAGSGTTRAVQKFQRRVRLTADGVAGPRTRRALGRLGRPDLGARTLQTGMRGWDVAELQFKLAWRGFPSGTFDGVFGSHVERAVRKYQRWARLPVDGVAGPGTIAALGGPIPRAPLRLSSPVAVGVTDVFGPRGSRFHTGVDFPAASGTGAAAARSGRVVFAGWHSGGFGYLVVIGHGYGVRTLYAHLSAIDVRRGQRVAAGTQIGRVGATGTATGPHLHFEVRVRGAAVDPLPALG